MCPTFAGALVCGSRRVNAGSVRGQEQECRRLLVGIGHLDQGGQRHQSAPGSQVSELNEQLRGLG